MGLLCLVTSLLSIGQNHTPRLNLVLPFCVKVYFFFVPQRLMHYKFYIYTKRNCDIGSSMYNAASPRQLKHLTTHAKNENGLEIKCMCCILSQASKTEVVAAAVALGTAVLQLCGH